MGPTEHGKPTPWRRTRWTASCSALLVAVTLALPQAGSAGEAAPASVPETGEIRNGTAKATAVIARTVPGVGDLSLGITSGTAVTQVTNSLAQATSQAMDLGLIGSSLTAESCGEAATVSPDELPQPTFVDNRDGDASAARDESGPAGAPFAAGRMEAASTQEVPEARARTTASAFELPGAMSLGGGRSEAVTRVLPGEGREAVARVQSALSMGGVVELSGMRWEAHHRTGVDPLATGSFEIARAEVGGIPFPTDELTTLEARINEVLALSGIQVSFPRTQRLVTPSDLIRVTPLQIEIRDSPLGATALGPALELTRQQRSQLFDGLVEVYCKSASVLLVGDIGLSVLGGTGFLTFTIGGVEASSSDLELGDPFGSVPPAAAPPPPPAAGGPGDADAIDPPAAPGSAPATGEASAAAPAEQALPAAAPGPVEERCESIHPNRSGCSDGATAVVGVLGLLATAGVAGADLRRQRRRPAAEAG